MKHATRLERIPAYPLARWSAEVEAARAHGLDVIRLDVGSPDLAPSDAVVGALCDDAKRADCHRYPGYQGIAAFRRAVAAYYRDRFDVTVDPDSEIMPLIGSKEGIVNIALALLDPGDVVLVPDPCCAPYVAGGLLAGAEVFRVPPSAGQ